MRKTGLLSIIIVLCLICGCIGSEDITSNPDDYEEVVDKNLSEYIDDNTISDSFYIAFEDSLSLQDILEFGSMGEYDILMSHDFIERYYVEYEGDLNTIIIELSKYGDNENAADIFSILKHDMAELGLDEIDCDKIGDSSCAYSNNEYRCSYLLFNEENIIASINMTSSSQLNQIDMIVNVAHNLHSSIVGADYIDIISPSFDPKEVDVVGMINQINVHYIGEGEFSLTPYTKSDTGLCISLFQGHEFEIMITVSDIDDDTIVYEKGMIIAPEANGECKTYFYLDIEEIDISLAIVSIETSIGDKSYIWEGVCSL